ncbi:hypothetical protein CR513_28433, partial [Mucuna pruriens]
MATASSLFSQGSIISFLGTSTITAEKLNWKNYRAWLDSVELWFLGQEFHDHLEKQQAEIPEKDRTPWLKLDYQLCAILWQSTNARDVFANDIVSLQQTNHDMVLHIAKAKAAAEELKDLLMCNY